MTGPEHYREAERLIALPADDRGIQIAQVHATLALAAAMAAAIPAVDAMTGERQDHNLSDWAEAGAWRKPGPDEVPW